jgi:hypothetical protein
MLYLGASDALEERIKRLLAVNKTLDAKTFDTCPFRV